MEQHGVCISGAGLTQILGNSGLVVLDASWCPQGSKDLKKTFNQKRIPGARFFDHNAVSDQSSSLPQACPSPESFALCMGELGIGREDRVVVYEADGDFGAAHAWFLFKLFGHKHVQVLEGGLSQWEAHERALETGPPPLPAPDSSKTYECPKKTDTAAMQLDVAEALANLKTQRLQVVDCREQAKFAGEATDELYTWVNGQAMAFEGLRPGRIPGARGLPATSLLKEGALLPLEELRRAFSAAGVDLDAPVAVVGSGGCCCSGVVLMALSCLGAPALRIKDGMAAWTSARAGTYPLITAGPRSTQQRPEQLQRVVLWAVPRSRSTAFERAVGRRTDAMVMHELLTEPFLKAHDAENFVKIQAGQKAQEVASSGCCYDAMLEVMLASYDRQGTPLFFTKELTCYFHNETITDAWLKQFHHVILVRNPTKTVESLYRTSLQENSTTYFDPSEAGFIESFNIFERVVKAGGQCMVIDSDEELMRNPSETLRRFCDFSGVAFESEMLTWDAKELSEWQKFRGWHNDVAASTGFTEVKHAEIAFPPAVEEKAAEFMPFYQALMWQTEKAQDSWPMLTQGSDSDAHLLCAGHRAEALPKLLAARLPDFSSYTADPKDLEASRRQCSDMCDKPLVVCGSAAAVLRTTELLLEDFQKGELCLLRLVIIGNEDDGRQVAHLGLPVSIVSPADLRSAKQPEAVKGIRRDVLTDLEALREKAQGIFASHNAKQPDRWTSWRTEFAKLMDSSAPFVALADEEVQLSLPEVLARASQVAEVVASLGRKGGFCAIYLERTAVTCWAAIGCMMAGSQVVDIAAWSSASDLARLLDQVKPDLVVTTSDLVENLPPSLEGVDGKVCELRSLVADKLEPPGAGAKLFPLKPESPGPHNEGAFSVLTSGTTSASKVVLCPQAALTDALPYFQKALRPGDRVGLFFLYYYFLCPMLLRCTTFVIPNTVFLDPQTLCAFIKRHRLAAIYVTPSLLESCVKNTSPEAFREAFATMHTVFLTGEVLRSEGREEFARRAPHCALLNCYSINETGDLAMRDEKQAGQYDLLEGVKLQVLDSKKRPVPPGTVGEIHVQTMALFRGYATAQGEKPREGGDSYRVGDLVRWHGAGRLSFVGRSAGAHVKIRGFKVSPDGVETLLASYPGLAAAWVAAVGSTDQEMRLEAAVLPGHGTVPGAAELRQWLQAQLPYYMVPTAFYRLEERPIMESGKKFGPGKVAELFGSLAPLEGGSQTEALTPEQAQLAEAWRTVLAQPRLDLVPSDSFFDLGGSLKFVQLSQHLSQEQGLDLTIASLLRTPTLEAMARAIARRAQGQGSDEVFSAQKEADAFPLSGAASGAKRTAGDVLSAFQAKKGCKKRVLLTGATGYVGTHLMQVLAENPEVEQLVCLVRSRGHGGHSPLLDSCKKQNLPCTGTAAAWTGKLRAVTGDVCQSNLALSPEDYEVLGKEVDIVLHAAAEVNMVKTYSSLAHANVGGTANVLNFCARFGKPHLFLSTELPPEGREATGYRLSKAVAEELCSRAYAQLGVPSAVLQLGDIGLSRQPGASLPGADYLIILLRACTRLGLYPEADWAVSIMAVDDTCSMLSQLLTKGAAEDFDAKAREVKGNLVLWEDLQSWLSPELPLRKATLLGWKNAVAAAAKQGPGQALAQQLQLLLPGMEEEFQAEAVRYHRGEGRNGKLGIDHQWALGLGRALASEARARCADEDSTLTWAALAPKEELVPLEVKLPALGEQDVEVQVTHCGLCGSDVHLIDEDWGECSAYPQVCGHEIVGVVKEVGASVTRLRKGMRVGVGWQRAACLECKHCLQGEEMYCEKTLCTCAEGQLGGFAKSYRGDSRFAYEIPQGLPSAHAAPLLCAGHTVFSALLHTKPGDKVAVLGFGGLGHLAVQFAAKRGCITSVISSSPSKEAGARAMGATGFVMPKDFEANENTFDYVMVTTSAETDWNKVATMLRAKGALVFVGAVPPVTLDVFTMGFKGQRVITTNTGGRKDMQDMLEFSAAMGIRPLIEVLPMEEVNKGINKLRKNDVQYRVVFEVNTAVPGP